MSAQEGAQRKTRFLAAARTLIAALAGVALALSFPKPGAWVLALPGLGTWFALWATAAPRRALVEGFTGGFAFFAILVRWFAYPLSTFTTMGSIVAWVAPAAAAVGFGVLTAAAGWTAARWAAKGGRPLALAVTPALWIGIDVLREQYPFPFPWGTLAGAFAPAPGAADAAVVVGTYGLSLVLGLGAALFGALLLGRRRRVLAALAVWLGLLLGLVAGGRWFAGREPAGAPVRVAVVQGAAWRQPDAEQLTVYEQLTGEAAGAGARIVVWPESASPFDVDDDLTYRRRLEALARRLDIDLVVGSITKAPRDRWYNSAVLIRGDTGLAGVQAKRVLVPFGEYMPMRWLFGNIPALTNELGQDFAEGGAPVVLKSRFAPLGALVCFEAIYPDLVSALRRRGATVLVNITNDSWYGATSGPWQHLDHALLRAPETGAPFVRAANSGVSIIEDREGRIVKQLGLGQRGCLIADLQPATATPPGAAVGEWVRNLCAIFALAALIAAFFMRGGLRPRRGEDRGALASPAAPGGPANGLKRCVMI